MELVGNQKGIKGGKSTSVVLTERSLEWCLKYRDVKEKVFKTEPDDDEPFFVNYSGKGLGPIQNTPGSLCHKFGIVTGVSNFTITSVRRGIEPRIQNNPDLKKIENRLASHTSKTGLKYYDRETSSHRAALITHVGAIESPSKSVSDLGEPVSKKRRIDNAKDKRDTVAAAKKLIADKKEKNSAKRRKISPIDRQFLQILFKSSKVSRMLRYTGKFPGKSC